MAASASLSTEEPTQTAQDPPARSSPHRHATTSCWPGAPRSPCQQQVTRRGQGTEDLRVAPEVRVVLPCQTPVGSDDVGLLDGGLQVEQAQRLAS